MIIKELINEKEIFFHIVKDTWLSASDTFPEFLTEVSSDEKKQNEDYLDKVTEILQKQIKKYRQIPIGRREWRTKTLACFNDILYGEEILYMHLYLTRDQIGAFSSELKEFMRTARKFAPELSIDGIGQAIRNYIVYAMFKQIHLVDSGFQLTAFGYSMLYPFTDNYIDNTIISDHDKTEYNHMIRNKLKGLEVYPKSLHEQKTCQLLQYIEDFYKRNCGSPVYELLLMMLDAQEISIKQQNKSQPLSLEERLDISIFKGGVSVLMDRFFVNKEFTYEDIIFYLGFGFFLQLADDLQDIMEDSSLGHSNLFTMELNYGAEEKIVNKMFHFLHQLMKSYPADNEPMKDFLMQNSFLLISSSLLRSKEFFSPEYQKKLEKYFPVNFSYWQSFSLSKVASSDSDTQKKYISILDELIKLS